MSENGSPSLPTTDEPDVVLLPAAKKPSWLIDETPEPEPIRLNLRLVGMADLAALQGIDEANQTPEEIANNITVMRGLVEKALVTKSDIESVSDWQLIEIVGYISQYVAAISGPKARTT
jgi:hypothetical protein